MLEKKEQMHNIVITIDFIGFICKLLVTLRFVKVCKYVRT